ncbi:MAG TPA: periplasmic heavy metal sensor [Candidatus Binatia bacterium]
MSKAAKLVFLASLILNIMLLGVILGHVPRSFSGTPSRQERMEQGLKKLPEPAQSHIRAVFARIRAAGDPARDQMEASRAEALRLLAAEPFDESAYDREVAKFDQSREQMFKQFGQAIKEATKELSPDERRMFAEILRRPTSR